MLHRSNTQKSDNIDHDPFTNWSHKRFEIYLHDGIQELRRVLKMPLEKLPVAEMRQTFVPEILSPLRNLNIHQMMLPGACDEAKNILVRGGIAN